MRRFKVHFVTEIDFVDGDEAADDVAQNYKKHLAETVQNAVEALSLRTIQGSQVENVLVEEIKAERVDITKLKTMVTAAQEEFYIAMTCHEVWKPAAYDKDLHSRMGKSYASRALMDLRDALRRETVLALMRLWDKDKRAVRMSLIAAMISESAVIDALAAERAKPFDRPGVIEQMRACLQANADKVIELTNKYLGGSHNAVREDLLRVRHERLAHRQIEPSTIACVDKLDEAFDEFYRDNAAIIRELLHLANGEAYDPLTVAEIYQRCATEFWAGVRGERTEGHPHFRPSALPS